MNIFVFIKQVPHTESRIGVSPDGKEVDLKNVTEWVINPYDEYAIEEALRIREKFGGTVSVVSLGEERVKNALKTALGMGADNAFHILIEDSGYDVLRKGYIAFQFLKERDFDLIFTGKVGIDYYLASFPLILAQFLNIPCLSAIVKLEIEGKKVLAFRETEMGKEVCETSLPAIFTAEKGLNEPRYPTLRLLMAAQKKEILTKKGEEISSLSFSPTIQVLNTYLPPPRKQGRIIEGEPEKQVKELVRLLREEARVI
ncbi:MAG: electron transfer flavoprotein subunit beta/FixA family protein [candidate division WOR-3 bacterium]